MLRFLRVFFGFLFLATLGSLIMVVALAAAQNGGGLPLDAGQRIAATASDQGASRNINERVMISEDLTFSWPIVVMLCVSAAGYAGVVASVRLHHASRDLHPSKEQLNLEYARLGECGLRHLEVNRRLVSIEDAVKGADSKLDELLKR